MLDSLVGRYGRLAGKLAPTTLEAKQVLYRPNQRIEKGF